MTAKATFGGVERMFLTFGFVHSKIRNQGWKGCQTGIFIQIFELRINKSIIVTACD